jgi:hypothetical protein
LEGDLSAREHFVAKPRTRFHASVALLFQTERLFTELMERVERTQCVTRMQLFMEVIAFPALCLDPLRL